MLQTVLRKYSSERFIFRTTAVNLDDNEDDDDIIGNENDKDDFASIKWGKDKSSKLARSSLSNTSHGERNTNLMRCNIAGCVIEEDSTASTADDGSEDDLHEEDNKVRNSMENSQHLGGST
jgi:hypothetical protein